MNNKNRFIALFFALFLLSFCLISCETQLGTFDGKISFSLSESTISSIMSRAVSEAGSSNSDILTFKIDLLNSDDSMIDSKSETHSFAEWNTLSNIDMSFDNVLVGSYVYAVATVSTPQKVICRGESQKTKVRKNRDTELSITMDYVGGASINTYTITVTLNKPTEYNSMNHISGSLYYLPADSADVSTLKAYAVSAMNMGSSVMYIQDADSLTAITNRATKIKDFNAGTVSETFALDSEANLNRYIFAKVSYKDSNSSSVTCLALPQDSVTLNQSGTTLSLNSYALGTPYLLWSDVTSKFSSYSPYTSAEGSYTTSTRGAQAFDIINSGTSITNSINSSSYYWDAFCFGGNYLFVLKDSGVLEIYKATDSGYTTVTTGDLRTGFIAKSGINSQYYYVDIWDIEFCNGYLYFSLSDSETHIDKLVRIKAPVPSNESNWNLSNCEWAWTAGNISMSTFVITGDKIYYSDNYSIGRRSYSATAGSVSEAGTSNGTITVTDSDACTINPSSLGLDSNESFYVKDMQINGSTLYVLIYNHDYYPKISNGGILKFPIDTQTFEPAVWSQNIPVPKILGWYKTSEGTIQPPLNSDKVYFYGPQKFIAKKPDELVIADDGAYFDGENHKLYFKERAVTVNLLTESLSAVDVNVTFTCTFNSCGYN